MRIFKVLCLSTFILAGSCTDESEPPLDGNRITDVGSTRLEDGSTAIVGMQDGKSRELTKERVEEAACISGSQVCIVRRGDKCGIFLKRKLSLGVPVERPCSKARMIVMFTPCEGECFSFDDGSKWVVKDDQVSPAPAQAAPAQPSEASAAANAPEDKKVECDKLKQVPDAAVAAAFAKRDWPRISEYLLAEFDVYGCAHPEDRSQHGPIGAFDARLKKAGLSKLRIPVRVDPRLKGLAVTGQASACRLKYGFFGTELLCRLEANSVKSGVSLEKLDLDLECDGGGEFPPELVNSGLDNGPSVYAQDDGSLSLSINRCMAIKAKGVVLIPRKS